MVWPWRGALLWAGARRRLGFATAGWEEEGRHGAPICRAAGCLGVRARDWKADEILGEDHGARLREGGDDSDSGAVSTSERASRGAERHWRAGLVTRA